MEVAVLIPRDVVLHSQQASDLRLNYFNLEECGRKQWSEKDTGLRRLAQHFGFQSSFHVGIFMSAVSSAFGRQPKENDLKLWSLENTDLGGDPAS